MAVGIGTLVKGPVAIVLVGGQILLYLLITRQWRLLGSAQIWAALALALLIAAPWYAGMVHLHGGFFIESFLEAQNVTRYVKAEHAATSGLFLFVPILLVAFLPWTLAFFPALVTACRRAKAQLAELRGVDAEQAAAIGADSPDTFAVLWAALVFVFFSASQTKLVTYIYPLYPLVACFTGYWVSEIVRRKACEQIAAAMLVIVAAGYAGAAVFLKDRSTTLEIAAAFAVVLISWFVIVARSRSNGRLAGRAAALRYVVPPSVWRLCCRSAR